MGAIHLQGIHGLHHAGVCVNHALPRLLDVVCYFLAFIRSTTQGLGDVVNGCLYCSTVIQFSQLLLQTVYLLLHLLNLRSVANLQILQMLDNGLSLAKVYLQLVTFAAIVGKVGYLLRPILEFLVKLLNRDREHQWCNIFCHISNVFVILQSL